MSSELPDSTSTESTSPKPTKWPRWRISMLVGALILLAASIGDAAIDGLPRWIYVVVFFTGYIFLSYGFFLAMSVRREAQKNRD